MATPKLFEIRLPAGDVAGFDIGAHNENGGRYYDPSVWLSQGYTGVRFIGEGKGRTHLRPAAGVWTNVWIEPHAGTVSLESLTLHGRGRSALQAGRDTGAIVPGFKVSIRDFELISDGPVHWGGFFYKTDTEIEDGDIWWGEADEHPFYHHGASLRGSVLRRLRFHECAAQCIKFRVDPSDTPQPAASDPPKPMVFAPWHGKKVDYIIEDNELLDWYRPRSSRGGSGICIEGGGARLVRIARNLFRAPTRSFETTKCIMIDDGGVLVSPDGRMLGGKFRDPLTGIVGKGFANGDVVVRDNGLFAGPGNENLSIVMRVGALGSGQKAARSFLVEGNAIYGQRLQLQMSDVAPGKLIVRNNNTETIKATATGAGYDTSHEALIPLRDMAIPVSRGYVA